MGFATCDNICYTGLGLGLGGGYCSKESDDHDSETKKLNKKMVSLKHDHLFPRLSLGLPEDDQYVYHNQPIMQQQQDSSNVSVSSFSNSSVKKERDQSGFGEQEVDIERAVLSSSRVSDEDEDGSPRKKLRLTKEQAAILEDNFTEHSTLNPKQKQALADRLNLRPRQVEVWFQNRRARTKLKQTEVDCELLKKCCETLTEENKRLHKELQELKSMKLGGAFYMQIPAATLSMCPSCERLGSGGGGGGGGEAPSSLTKFTVATTPHFFSPFTHPSPAL